MGYFFDRFANDNLNKMYELLADVTPLRFDCGALCGAACCKGEEEDGMLLFPGEEGYYRGREDFTVRRNDAFGCDEVVCHGSCRRDERPLSCRIYPYFFYVSKEGRVTVAHDVRAIGRCPLTKEGAGTDKTFLRRMRLCAKAIEADGELLAFVKRLSDDLTDFGKLA